MLLKMSILKMSSNTEIREKGECAAVRAVGQGLFVRCLTFFEEISLRRFQLSVVISLKNP